jgi:hypothetical protein
MVRGSDCRVIAALEDRRWETVPLVQTLGMRFPRERFAVVRGNGDSIPADVFNAAIAEAQGEFLHFVWPGCLPDQTAVSAACTAAEVEDLDWLGFVSGVADKLPELCSPDLEDRFYSYYLACGRFLPLCQAVVRRTSVLELGGFDASSLLQRHFDAEFWLRSVRRGQRGLIRRGTLAETAWDWNNFPLQRDFRVPSYVAQSYRVRAAGRAEDTDREQLLRDFAADLPPTLGRTVERLQVEWADGAPAQRVGEPHQPADGTCCARPTMRSYVAPGRIAVTGGPWEFAHNQLCFFNHFAELEGQGRFTYVPLLDHLIVPERDLHDIDAVIISRGRHPNVRKIIDHCRRESIATLYMIDDNWLTVGSDWPDPYAAIFAPGLPQYEMFLSCLRECDAVLTYSDVLAEDVRPYVQRLIQLPTNVRQADFAAPLRHHELRPQVEALLDWREQTGGVLAGYIGSQRFSEGAFRALASPAIQSWRPVKIVLFGVVSEEQRQLFGSQAAILPYVGYDHYAAAIGMLAPDILVAPLDDSRTSRSKCPNKYLEYSVAGAAGVYSSVPPYVGTVVDGRTGLLVANDSEEAWTAAIARLAEDTALRKSIAAAARADVMARYETSIVAPQFAAAIEGLIRRNPARCARKEREVATC